MTSKSPANPRRVLYVVSEDFAFLLNRLPMARAAREAGFEVHVATNVDKGAEEIEAEGFILHRFRSGAAGCRHSPRSRRCWRSARVKKTDQAGHHSSSGLQCCVYGSIAALGEGMPLVNAITGLGYIFTSITWRTRLLRKGMVWLLPWLLNASQSLVLVQNPDDRPCSRRSGSSASAIVLIPGSGVDTDRPAAAAGARRADHRRALPDAC